MNSNFRPHLLTPATDTLLLEILLEKIRAKHTPEHAGFTIRWGIPHATVVRRVYASPTKISAHDQTLLSDCKALLALGRWSAAAVKLQPLADAGIPEAECLISHALKRTGGEWETYATRYAERMHRVQLVPASCHDKMRQEIILHPYLSHRKAPQFVLSYLIYHESIACLYPADANGIPNKPFTVAEKKAPYREKAIQWLSRHGFPVYQIGPETD